MTVYVVQEAMQRNRATGELEAKFDYGPAEEYGELVFLLNDSARPFIPTPLIDELHEKLKDFGDQDYLLLTGNPLIMSMAFAIAADANDGNVKVLQWHGKSGSYTAIEVRNVFADCGPASPGL